MRVDDSYSALFAAHEDTFISIAEGKDQGHLTETIYKMNKKEKDLLDNFLYVRNNGLLFNKCNVDVNGKATIVDPDTGRPGVLLFFRTIKINGTLNSDIKIK